MKGHGWLGQCRLDERLLRVRCCTRRCGWEGKQGKWIWSRTVWQGDFAVCEKWERWMWRDLLTQCYWAESNRRWPLQVEVTDVFMSIYYGEAHDQSKYSASRNISWTSLSLFSLSYPPTISLHTFTHSCTSSGELNPTTSATGSSAEIVRRKE